ncbi:Ig-like domain-containing protein [Psychrobacter urativorans]|uniref:Big-1 domain-containing protein n=1 Tax=Psychrobacter urativorans TaxID=45610 RepID=A0A0M4TC03_9GAMM|nr:hypothetical protein [Psychrobacter urativorans]ALF59320.1 hypothetical protein AOC03_04025 [Psychrobacter urativorans]
MSYSSLPTSKLFQLTFLTCALALAGCGGGDAVDSIAPAPGGGNGNGNGGGGAQQPLESLNIKTSKLVNTDGNIINTVSLDGAYYEVEVTDNNNQPVLNAKVNFTIDAEGITLSQTTSGSMLTDSEGKARIFLKPNSPEVSGAYTISAAASFKGNTATNELTFSVQATNVAINLLKAAESDLPSGGQTVVSLKVSDTAGNPLSGMLVNLNASCGQIPTQMSSDSDGMVEVVYKAINPNNTLCSGAVNISASAGRATQTTKINVQLPEATSIVYTSNPLTLGIQNSGSSATGSVEFTVYSNTTPLANASVSLSLEKSPLGLTFGVLGNRNVIPATTDANGKISVNIYPGSTPGPVEIKATLVRDSRINALSKDISIASSRVTQDGLSLSMGKNVLDWAFDGDKTDVMARLVDVNGNKVPDGTVVSFTAEGGKVFPSSCNTVNGECKVEFSTQNPRPGDGRVSVLAVAEGEKAYIDKNENNAWDKGDTFVHNIGDTFRDDNENGTFEKGEFTYPLMTQATGQCENNVRQFINLKFPSLTEIKKQAFEENFKATFVSPNKPMTCNSGLDAVVRYQSIQLLSNGSGARFTLGDLDNNNIFSVRPTQAIDGTDNRISVRINSGGFYDLNPMPSGSTITGTIVDKTKGEKNCEIDLIGGADKVPDLVSTGKPGVNTGTINTYALNQCEAGDYFKISVTSPRNNTTTQTYVIQ